MVDWLVEGSFAVLISQPPFAKADCLQWHIEKKSNETLKLYYGATWIPKCFPSILRLIFEFDPDASCVNEVIVSYPGFYAITVYFIAHELAKVKRHPTVEHNVIIYARSTILGVKLSLIRTESNKYH